MHRTMYVLYCNSYGRNEPCNRTENCQRMRLPYWKKWLTGIQTKGKRKRPLHERQAIQQQCSEYCNTEIDCLTNDEIVDNEELVALISLNLDGRYPLAYLYNN